MSKPLVLTIVGPTASGKTSLAISIAKAFRGEVISADSRQVYRGLDLGTGKVTPAEMDGIPHHLLDVADPMTTYTVTDFVTAARKAITEIHDRKHLPIIAGGTFFYLDALLGRHSAAPVPPNSTLRAALADKSLPELYAILLKLDPSYAQIVDKDNPRRLLRAIEIATTLGSVPPPHQTNPYQVLTLGIQLDQATLHQNIWTRLETRLTAGMVEEVDSLLAAGVSHERLEALGLEYRYISRYRRQLIDFDTMKQLIFVKTKQFGKRQYTWLKRDETIVWVDPTDEVTIHTLVQNFLTIDHPN